MVVKDYSEAFEPIQLELNLRSRSTAPMMTISKSSGSLYFNISAARLIPWNAGDLVMPYKFGKKFMFKKADNGPLRCTKLRTGGGLQLNSKAMVEFVTKTSDKKYWIVTVDGDAVYVE